MNFHDNPALDLTRHKSTSRVNLVGSENLSSRDWRMQPQFLGQYLCVYSINICLNKLINKEWINVILRRRRIQTRPPQI